MTVNIYGSESPVQISPDTNRLSERRILESVKDLSLFGRGGAYRGRPESVQVEDIFCYTNKNGRVVCQGPRDLDSVPEYREELFEKHGILCRESLGKIYWISTTKPNPSMSDPVSGVSTGFQYRVYNDGSEDLYFDAIPSGNTPDSCFKLTKISDQSLRAIVKEMNPDSKLI